MKEASHHSVRLAGAAIAAAIWCPLALLLILVGDTDGLALAVAGLLVSPVVGAWLAPRVRSATSSWKIALWFAIAATLAGALAFGVLAAALEGHPFDGVGYALVGLLFLGIPMLILGFNMALLWVVVLRRLR